MANGNSIENRNFNEPILYEDFHDELADEQLAEMLFLNDLNDEPYYDEPIVADSNEIVFRNNPEPSDDANYRIRLFPFLWGNRVNRLLNISKLNYGKSKH